MSDQFIKLIFVTYWPEFLVKNKGVAFGLATPLWLVLATFIILAGLALRSWYKNPDHWEAQALGFALILGGAVSNLIDRAAYGAVLDYIDLKVWPVFNLADSAIFIGALGLLWYALRPTSHGQNTKDKSIFAKNRCVDPRAPGRR